MYLVPFFPAAPPAGILPGMSGLVISEVTVPGTGRRFECAAPSGARLVVLCREDGTREVSASAPLELDAATARRVGALLAGASPGFPALDRVNEALRDVRLEWFPVAAASPLAGWTIGDLAIRKTTGVSVVALVRGPETFLNPGPEHVVHGADAIVILGRESQVHAFRERYRPEG
jgi:TrkA domain protein